jgi:phosphotransferase system enzyme I (PtsP)
MGTEVCSIYLFRDEDTLELCATEGLNPDCRAPDPDAAGRGSGGARRAQRGKVNTPDAPGEAASATCPRRARRSFLDLGVPIQRLGETLGVLVVQSKEAREFSADEVYALEVVAMVVAEMTELGAFVGEGAAMKARHKQAVLFNGTTGQEGAPKAMSGCTSRASWSPTPSPMIRCGNLSA